MPEPNPPPPPEGDAADAATSGRRRGAATHRPWLRWLGWAARFGVAAAGVAVIVVLTQWTDEPMLDAAGQAVIDPGTGAPAVRPGLLTLVGRAEPWKLVLGFVVLGLVWPIQATRWWWLLRAQGLIVSWRRTFRLTMVGAFFNFCVPVGSTGGDVVRAYYAAAGSRRKLGAVLSIVADRLAGTLGLVLLAGLLALTLLHEPVVRTVALFAWSGLAAALVGWWAYVSPSWRRWLLLETVLRVKALRPLDEVGTAFARRPVVLLKAVGVSVVSHLCLCTAAAMAGLALGLDAEPRKVLAVLPVAFAAAALPVSYQGLGVMEGVAYSLLDAGRASWTPIVGMLILYRLYMLGWALLGALGLIGGNVRLNAATSADNPASP
jgi:glycosyltransferase 2 family protein